MNDINNFCKLPVTRTKAYSEATKVLGFPNSPERKSIGSSGEKHSPTLPHNNNLLDLAKNDYKVRLWESILTSIISVTKEFEQDLASSQFHQKIQHNPLDNDTQRAGFIEEKAKNKIELQLEQLIFDSFPEKRNFIKIVDYQSPTRKLSSNLEQRNLFIEERLKTDKKFDFSISLNITEFAPELFHLLRVKNGIHFEHIYDSFSIERNFDLKIADTKEFLGKSDSIFFFSSDNKFVLKSISENNFLSLIHRMKDFFEYFTRKHEDSFLVKIFGAYTIEIDDDEKVNLILMENLFASLVDNTILRIYDLKGSKHNRAHEDFMMKYKEQKELIKSLVSQDEEIELTNEFIPIVRGTDIDFLNSDDVEINFKKEGMNKFNGIVESDVSFLSNINIMDYSLLFIKALEGGGKKEENNNLGRFRRYESADRRYVYCFAIVDYLQTYDLFKVFESNIKSFFIKCEEISCRDPIAYSDRFLKFISSLTKEEGE